MKESRIDSVRNVAVVSNTGGGKTSLVEALLFTAGVIPGMGAVTNGTTVSDFEPEEIHRRTSLSASAMHFTWQDTRINLLDTPGALSFMGETQAALRAVDGVLIVVGASMGVRTELLKIWSLIQDLNLPCLLFVNELDKPGTSFRAVVEDCQKALGITPLPITFPVGEGVSLEGVADVLRGEELKPRSEHVKVQHTALPDGLLGDAAEAKKKLVEGVAEIDDRLLEKYLSEGDLTNEDLMQGIRADVLLRKLVPVLSGSATRNIGTTSLLDAVVAFLPSPADRATVRALQGVHPHTGESVMRRADPADRFSGVVFKTIIDPFVGRLSYVRVLSGTLAADTGFFNATRKVREKGGHVFSILGKKYIPIHNVGAGDIVAIGKLKDTLTGDTVCDDHDPISYPGLHLAKPVMSFAIEPKSKADIEKVSLGLHKLIEEDPTLEFVRNAEPKEMVLNGMGQLHIDVAFERLRRKYGVEVTIHTPKIPYKETVRTVAQAQGRYKKQTGGHGQYGDCWLQLTPLSRGKGFEFENKIVGGAIPRNFIPAVEKGVIEALHEGILAGYPVVDLRVTVYDGSYHVVDSSEMSFKIAGSMGFKKAMEAAHPVLLEPLMNVTVEAPEEYVGAVIGDLNSRRGRIAHVTANGSAQTIRAVVPLAEMLKYAPSLNSITGGRGSYEMEFTAYEEVPRDLAVKIVDEHKTARQTVAVH
ncbi:MAG: elongation factor G [Nitrospiraceae bacterium]